MSEQTDKEVTMALGGGTGYTSCQISFLKPEHIFAAIYQMLLTAAGLTDLGA